MFDYLIHLGILFAIYGILGISLNLVVGYTGLISMAQAAFYGIGAYATAIILTQTGMNFFLSIILGILTTALVSLAIGLVLSKFKGDYYALGSFGFTIIVFSIFLNWQKLTNGPMGSPGIPRPEFLGIDFSNNFLLLQSLFLVYHLLDISSRIYSILVLLQILHIQPFVCASSI